MSSTLQGTIPCHVCATTEHLQVKHDECRHERRLAATYYPAMYHNFNSAYRDFCNNTKKLNLEPPPHGTATFRITAGLSAQKKTST
jgi:hypothetical protein